MQPRAERSAALGKLARRNEALNGRNHAVARILPPLVEWLRSGAALRIRQNVIDG